MGANNSTASGSGPSSRNSTPPPQHHVTFSTSTAPQANHPPPTAPPAPATAVDGSLFASMYDNGVPSTKKIEEVFSNDATLQCRALAARDYVMRGTSNRTHALVDIQGLKQTRQVERQAFDLILLLDNSGSMSGEPINLAKQTVSLMLKEITAKDTVTLITYNSSAQTEFFAASGSAIADAQEKVQQVRATGGTNMSAGMRLAETLLDQLAEKDSLKAMFVLSDGHPNEGTSSAEGLAAIAAEFQRKRCRVSSMGIGKNYNEQLLRAISDAGEGDYLYIPDAVNIPKYIGQAFAGLTTSLGSDAVLYVLADADHCTIMQAENFTNNQLLTGLPIGLLREENLQQVLLHLDIRTTAPVETEITLFTWRLQYNTTEGPQQVTGACKAEVTEDPEKLKIQQMDVVVALRLLEIGRVSEQIQAAVESDDREAARAMQMQSIQALSSVAAHDKSKRKKVESQLRNLQETNECMSRNWDRSALSKAAGYNKACSAKNSEWMYDCM